MKRVRLLIIFSLIICCLLAVCSCENRGALPKPEGVDVDAATLVLSWNEVEGARMYTISIKNENGEEKEVISSKASYSLTALAVGNYTIRVMANGKDGVSLDSAWSDPKEFKREAEPGMVFTLINGGTEYEVTGKGIATGDIVIPETYRGKPVTSIGKKAFFNKSDVDSVTLHDNITSIGEFAFANCSYLASVNLPSGLKYIGENAFSSCRILEVEVVIPDGVKEIPASAFAYCAKLPRVTIGAGVELIGKNAFADCKALTELVVPDNVKKIDEYAFSSCEKLVSVTIGNGISEIAAYAFSGLPLIEEVTLQDSVRVIGEGAFYKCSALKNVTLGDGVEVINRLAFDLTKIWDDSVTNEVYVGNWLLGLKDATATEITFKDGTVGLANYAISSNKALDSLILPDSVKIIGACAFAGAKLNSIVIGGGCEIINQQAFEGCENLTRVVLGSFDFDLGELASSKLHTIESYAFRGCTSLLDIDIPDTVKTIASYVFRDTGIYKNSYFGVVYADNWIVDYNENLDGEVTVADDTVGISNYAFYKCKALTSITIPSSVKIIGRAAFYQCVKLRSISLPETLETIEDYTFYHCDNLKITSLPPMLKSIGRSAFYKCGSVYEEGDVDTATDTLIIPAGVEFIGEYAFYGCGEKIDPPEGDATALPSIKGIDVVIIGHNIKVIEAHAFQGFVSLKELVIGDGVEVIGEKAFYQCTSLESVSFGSALTEIGSRAFYKCESLKAIDLPSGVTVIKDYAFYKCTSVTSVDLGDSVVSIGHHAFYGNSEIKELVFPESLVTIERQAFRGCSKLTSVILPVTVVNIDKHAFYGCANLTVYTELDKAPDTWIKYWNSSYRPVIWNCVLSENKDYVVSFEKKAGGITHKNDSNTLSAPIRDGYVFVGFATSPTASVAEYTIETVVNAEDGITLYVIWE